MKIEQAKVPKKDYVKVDLETTKQALSNEFSQDRDNLQVFKQQRGHYSGGVNLALNIPVNPKDDVSNILINSR